MNPKNSIDIMAHTYLYIQKSLFFFFLNNNLQYVRLFQIQVKSEYRLQVVRRIRIGVDIRLDHPLPQGSKKVVFRFRSVNSIVILAANTGNDNSSNTAVIKTDHHK